MAPGGGQLQIKDAEEPLVLEAPTTISGAVDETTGSITGGTLSTPQISFSRDITDPITATVFITATLSEVNPGSLTGSITSDGHLTITAAMAVRLHVVVGDDPTFLTTDCRTEPVNLTMTSTEPWDFEAGTGTIADADFTVPPMIEPPGEEPCNSQAVDSINEQLAGPGSSISLTLQGTLPRPQPERPASITTLAVSPAGEAPMGADVTMTATVGQDPAEPHEDPELVPSGLVEMLDGTRVLDTVIVFDGVATFTTSSLTGGTHNLRARYLGDGAFDPSTSGPVTYKIVTHPTISGTVPPTTTIGADTPAEFDITAANPTGGNPITNARIRLAIRRDGPGQSILPSRLQIHYQNDAGNWILVPGAGGGTVTAWIGTAEGFPLAPGASKTIRVRVAGVSNMAPGPVAIDFDLRAVDPNDTAEPSTETGPSTVNPVTEVTTYHPIASGTGRTVMVPVTRLASNVSISTYSDDPEGNVRPGYHLAITVSVGGSSSTPRTGMVEILLDGRVINARPTTIAADPTPQNPVSGNTTLAVPLPADLSTGSHVLVAHYLGDAVYRPSYSAAFPLQVFNPAGAVYECLVGGLAFGAHLAVQADLPSVATEGSVPVTRFEASLILDGSYATSDFFGFSVQPFDRNAIELSPGGSATATGITYTFAQGPELLEQTLVFTNPTGSVELTGAPGEVVPITIPRVTFSALDSFLDVRHDVACLPVGEPASLGSVTVAGTSLAVESDFDPVRAGDPVTLTATVGPASSSGTVEFLGGSDSTQVLGVAPVVDGVAVLHTEALAAGAHGLKARFNGGFAVPSSSSETVPLAVLPTLDCATFATGGNGDIVRLVYMELLGRCPDAAGFAHWTGQLDGGRSPESFARAISTSTEAIGRVVDDAYQTMLGRDADASGRAFWTAKLRNGRYDQLLADLAASPEFWAKAGSTNTGFVTRLYDRLLHRAPDSSGLTYWVGRLDDGTTRTAVTKAFANRTEPLGQLVEDAYQEILSRDPFTGERANAVATLRATGDRSGLYAQLIGTDEFAQRASQHPNPED